MSDRTMATNGCIKLYVLRLPSSLRLLQCLVQVAARIYLPALLSNMICHTPSMKIVVVLLLHVKLPAKKDSRDTTRLYR